MVSVSDDDYLYFVDRAVRGMAGIVADLGDEGAVTRPDLPGANTPYGLLTHCLGVIEYWAGHLVAGREIARDRDAEFSATGSVSELLTRVDDVLAQLALDVAASVSDEPLRHQPDAWAVGPDRPLNQGGVLLHVYEEVAQHHGQLEVVRDGLRAGPPAFDPPMSWLREKRGVKWHRPGPDLIPAWVADMDFPVAPPIRAAVTGMLDRGDLGYPDWSANPLAEVFCDRMKRRFGWEPQAANVRLVADLIQAVQIVLDLTTEPGDGVLAHLPNYPPFPATVSTMRRRLVPVQLHPDGGSWSWQLDEFERAAAESKVLLLVNPHNPTGRAFSRTELEQVAAIAEAHDLLVLSDEIHADLTHAPHEHIPFASLGDSTAARTVTITSATKAFNIAGVRTAVAHVGVASLRAQWDAQPPDIYGVPSTLGVEATIAAWRESDDWLDAVREHLHHQRDHLLARVADLPGISMRVPDAGYLAWLDCRDASLPGDPAAFFREHAGLELAPGPDYDRKAVGWLRLNFANSRAVLDEILDRMARALGSRA